MDINAVADELYSRPPEEFTAARNVFEREARAVGDKQMAAAIHQLRKPTTAAWLANQLVREHFDEVKTFLELGAAMRQATEMRKGDQLRELGKQRRQLLSDLMQQVRSLARTAGRKVSQDVAHDVEDTMNAALADGVVADQLSVGRLADALRTAGFPPSEGATPAGRAPTLTPADSPKGQRSERPDPQLDRARDEERQAQSDARTASDEQDQAQAASDRAKTALREAVAVVSQLRADLDKAKIGQSRREAERRKSQADLDSANKAAHEAARRLDDAVRRRERLSTYETGKTLVVGSNMREHREAPGSGRAG